MVQGLLKDIDEKISKNIYLMNKNDIVLEINISTGFYKLWNENKLPFQLRGKIRYDYPIFDLAEPELPQILPGESNFSSMKKMEKYQEDSRAYLKKSIEHNNLIADINYHNRDNVVAYFASRVLPITRDNAKKIYNLFGFDQIQTNDNKARIAVVCRNVSLLDDFWIKNVNDPITWGEVNLRHNHLNEIVAQVSLHGSSLTLNGKIPMTPELNGQGAYAKAWKREDGELWLYKLGKDENDTESRIEVMVSDILDKTNVEHIKYYAGESNGRYACKCRCMTDDTRSVISGMDFISYCNVNDKDANKEIMRIDSDTVYKMWIVDYLISNRDRHGMNWGFYYDSDSMVIQRMHPLYDHNNAFDPEIMADKDAEYSYDNNMTLRDAAKFAINKTNFMIDDLSREDFLTKDQYDSFKERMVDLGLGMKKEFYGTEELNIFNANDK